jgi:integrase
VAVVAGRDPAAGLLEVVVEGVDVGLAECLLRGQLRCELGRPIYPQRLTEAFTRERNAAGVLSGTLHTLRHSHASLALTNGVPLHVMAARLGDRPETVLRTYAHLLPQSDVEAAEQVAALIA